MNKRRINERTGVVARTTTLRVARLCKLSQRTRMGCGAITHVTYVQTLVRVNKSVLLDDLRRDRWNGTHSSQVLWRSWAFNFMSTNDTRTSYQIASVTPPPIRYLPIKQHEYNYQRYHSRSKTPAGYFVN